jgi:hypothetical protein
LWMEWKLLQRLNALVVAFLSVIVRVSCWKNTFPVHVFVSVVSRSLQ